MPGSEGKHQGKSMHNNTTEDGVGNNNNINTNHHNKTNSQNRNHNQNNSENVGNEAGHSLGLLADVRNQPKPPAQDETIRKWLEDVTASGPLESPCPETDPVTSPTVPAPPQLSPPITNTTHVGPAFPNTIPCSEENHVEGVQHTALELGQGPCQSASVAMSLMCPSGLPVTDKEAFRPFDARAALQHNEQRKQERQQLEADPEALARKKREKRAKDKQRRLRRRQDTSHSLAVGRVCSAETLEVLQSIPVALEKTVESEVLTPLIPTKTTIETRVKATQYVSQKVVDALRKDPRITSLPAEEIKPIIYGSLLQRTFLPDGDNDMTLIIKALRKSPADNTESLQSPTQPYSTDDRVDVRLLTLVYDTLIHTVREDRITVEELANGDVPVLKLTYGAFSVDVSINKDSGATTGAFVHYIDEKFGHQHLLKRSLLLLKAWLTYEAHITGAQNGYLGSYALTVMLVAVLNLLPMSVVKDGLPPSEKPKSAAEMAHTQHHTQLQLTPLKVLLLFLDYYSTFDFDKYAVTIYGPVRLSMLRYKNERRCEAAKSWAAEACSENDQIDMKNVQPASVDSVNYVRALRDVATPTPIPLPSDEADYKEGTVQRADVEAWLTKLQEKKELESGVDVDTSLADEHREYYIGPTMSRSSGGLYRPTQFPKELKVNYFVVRVMNVCDPIRPYSNLTRGVTRNHLARIQGCCRHGADRLKEMLGRVVPSEPDDYLQEPKRTENGEKLPIPPEEKIKLMAAGPVGAVTPMDFITDFFPSTISAASVNRDPQQVGELQEVRPCDTCREPTPFCERRPMVLEISSPQQSQQQQQHSSLQQQQPGLLPQQQQPQPSPMQQQHTQSPQTTVNSSDTARRRQMNNIPRPAPASQPHQQQSGVPDYGGTYFNDYHLRYPPGFYVYSHQQGTLHQGNTQRKGRNRGRGNNSTRNNNEYT